MVELIILGSSNAIPDEEHDNTHMVLVGKERLILIDCVNNELLHLKKSWSEISGPERYRGDTLPS